MVDYLNNTSFPAATDGRGTHPKDRNPLKAITAIGIVCAFGALLVASIMEGTNPMAFINIPALLLIVRRHVGRRHGVDELPDVHGDAQAG